MSSLYVFFGDPASGAGSCNLQKVDVQFSGELARNGRGRPSQLGALSNIGPRRGCQKLYVGLNDAPSRSGAGGRRIIDAEFSG